MKKFLALSAVCLFTNGAFATDSTSDYIVETGSVVIQGQAAMDLYQDLEAKEVVIIGVTRQETREKREKTIRCEAEYITGLNENNNQMADFVLDSVYCLIQLPLAEIGPRF